MTPSKVRVPLAGFVGSLALGTVVGVTFHRVGWVRDPLFLAITLASTSLGLVVPVLADAGLTETALGQLIIVGATAGEFGAITVLSLLFSETKGGMVGNMVAFGIFGAMVAVMAVTLGRVGPKHTVGGLPHPAPGHDCRDPGAHRSRPSHRLRGPRCKGRTTDHPRRLPGRGGAQPR